ncbi:unnamed protein product [Effrenium voratum]|nr:unnamed protein product [Effrenium voratum]
MRLSRRAAYAVGQEQGPEPLSRATPPGSWSLRPVMVEEVEEQETAPLPQAPPKTGMSVSALPLAQRPLPSSRPPLAEVSFEDAWQMPRHLWPWIAMHAELKQGQRIRLAAKAVTTAETEDSLSEVPLSQALQTAHWCWSHKYPGVAASSLVPMLFLGNEDSAVLHWVLMLLATQLWRKATFAEPREFLVDNGRLKAPGLSYFFSRRYDDERILARRRFGARWSWAEKGASG